MSDPAPGISCVVPVFNEAISVAATLSGIETALSGWGGPREILLVDDGSTDGTVEAAGKSGAAFRLLRHGLNRGYGAAIKTGCRHAIHPWILILDADGSYPPEEIPKLLTALAGDDSVDMVVGARSQTRLTDHRFRLGGKWILVRLANFLANTRIPDLNSGLRIMRKSLLLRYWSILPDGFSLTTSITLALLCSGATVDYTPIEYRRREGKSKIRPVRDMWNFIALILRTMIYFNPLKVFVPISLLLVLAAFVTVILSKVITHQVMDVTAIFLFIGGLQMLLIGIVADLVLKLTGMREK